MRFLISLLLVLSTHTAYSQKTLTPREKDSVKALVCHMQETDQGIRNYWGKVENTADSALKDSIHREMAFIDSTNFSLLYGIIKDIGYPCKELLGESACHPTAIMIHWSKQEQAWFSSKSMVPIFKREIDNGHMPQFIMDLCFFFYVGYTDADMQYYHAVNEARAAYGLKPYTRKEYNLEETPEVMSRDTDEERRRLGMKVKKQTPSRSAY